MPFHSILFPKTKGRDGADAVDMPECFVDLNLDQIIDAVTAGKQEYNLKPFFYTPLQNLDAIQYRHEIMRALENPVLFDQIKSFANKMRAMREQLAQAAKLFYTYQKQRWVLDAVQTYCDAVQELAENQSSSNLQARGLLAFREYLTEYVNSERFMSLHAEAQTLLDDLSQVRYCVRIKDNSVRVRKYQEEADYSIQVEETFAKFRQGAVKDYRAKFSEGHEMNHVEAQILDRVAQLYPDLFLRLDTFCENHTHFADDIIRTFDREIQFYVAYLEHIARFKRAGLSFCYPRVSDTDKQVCADEAFDLALAYKLLNQNALPVYNDFYLQDPERILVVTGPNQGGKTTFARMFGQLHYLASLGCPVPGNRAQLFLYDKLLTHFEREEKIENLRGKLEDDLVRIHMLVQQATPHSVIILNEIFNSTTLQDAIFLSREILEKIMALDALGVFVTFIDELASLGEKTVSMVSTVMPDNPAVHTFKIVRQPADRLAYALAIADKYRLTYDDLRARLQA
ncbi:MAG: DNA mismatch repair protein MutS [Chloroflexi bacterium]|nr:DNA mismatch repair protein MutS [Chloroflexota bacterium]